MTHCKKALIVGGSNGIGLAIGKELIGKGYFLIICDRVAPQEGVLDEKSYSYIHSDLRYPDEDVFSSLSSDPDISVLQCMHTAEIEKMFSINSVSTLKILRIFYDRILGNEDFYTGVMGSISGWMSSPSASVYAATKASVVRFIESVNIELEAYGSPNRILDVSPASFKGSRFYGAEKTDTDQLQDLTQEILTHLFSRDTRFIPGYEETFKDVLERYHSDPHEYGLHSYEYKKASGRQDNERRVVVGYLSGTFDLFHVGHLNLLMRAKEQCDYLIVGVHDSGKWKGVETFIPLEERKRIVASCKYVDKVIDSCREDSDVWDLYHYDKLFVGSDYKGTERFNRYEEIFKDKGVKIVYFPYTEGTSSTQIRQTILKRTEEPGK